MLKPCRLGVTVQLRPAVINNPRHQVPFRFQLSCFRLLGLLPLFIFEQSEMEYSSKIPQIMMMLNTWVPYCMELLCLHGGGFHTFFSGCTSSDSAILRAQRTLSDAHRLLTGVAAAQSHPEKQYFMAELVRFGFSVALEHAKDFKRTLKIFGSVFMLTCCTCSEILMNFIWLRRSLRTMSQ